MASTPTMDEAGILAFLTSLFAEDLHAKRVLSLSQCTLGVIHAASLAIHSIGIGMAEARGVEPKHAIKQVDRMLSNRGIDVWALFRLWVPFVLGGRRDIVVTMDWTEHDHDDQTTIAINLVTSHGRATPLIWKTVVKSALKDNRNEYEDQVIRRLHEVLPDGVRVTLLADRGFGDQKLYLMLADLGFDYVIRFREIIMVTDSEGESHPASDWVPTNGRARMIRDAFVTQDRCPVPAVVCVKEAGMKENWCLATSRTDLGGKNVVELYGKRFTTEENFRDTKDPKFGLGLSATHVGTPARRDRLLLIAALAQALLTLLGAAGEALGMDRLLKANTAKKRTHSLYRQGLHYYNAIPMMRKEKLVPLVEKFAELVLAQAICVEIFGVI
jgi:DDE family transposase